MLVGRGWFEGVGLIWRKVGNERLQLKVEVGETVAIVQFIGERAET